MENLTTTFKLNNGVEMPWVGYGTYKTQRVLYQKLWKLDTDILTRQLFIRMKRE